MSQIANNSTNYSNSYFLARPITIEKEPSEFVNKEKVLQLENIIHQTYPTDQICLTDSGVNCLLNLLMNCKNHGGEDENGKYWISSDIFVAQTVSILDCEIEVTDDQMTAPPISYRVSIFPDYFKKIEKASSEDVTFVGLIQFQKESLALCVKKEDNNLITTPLTNHKIVDSEIWGFFGVLWYSIEFALLHPVVKDVFAYPQRTEFQSSNKNHKKGKKGRGHKIKYIKRHVVNADVIENAMHENGGRKINRTTMLWYVSGHWRKYKNGKLKFIQPYWKGPLRNTKKDVLPRKREMVVASDNQDVG